jgi:hypothetical protein
LWCKKKRKETRMRHPFDLELAELEAIHANLQCLTEAELATVSGGSLRATTMALGEEGGQVTTMALGEEGGPSNSRRSIRRFLRACSEVTL